MYKLKNIIVLAVVLLLLAACNPKCKSPFPEGKHLVNTDEANKSIAMEGYDLVVIHQDEVLKKGNENYVSTLNGVHYHFTSLANKEKFDANPEKYKPQFGGFCAVAACFGKAEELTTYDLFDIKDGKLYFSKNIKAHKMYTKDPDNVIEKANNRWNCIVIEHGVDIADTYTEPVDIK